jgi:N-acetylmuramoyl-L-alanine amidase
MGLGSAAIAVAAFISAPAHAAQLTVPALTQAGNVAQMCFGLHGRDGRLRSSTHGNELWIDLERTRLTIAPDAFASLKPPLVEKLRVLDLGNRRTRLVLEFNARVDYAIARLPGELVVRMAPAGSEPDLTSSLRAAVERSSVAVPPVPRPVQPRTVPALNPLASSSRQRPIAPAITHPPAAIAALAPPHLPRLQEPPVSDAHSPLVMIDPGHGGVDPGTEAAAPFLEKTVALQIALKLAGALKARGIRSELTRETDYFVTLGGRTALANQSGADLFVSVHLNSSPDRATSGIETYYLNNTTDRATIRLARMENGAGADYGARQSGDLHYILSDMRQNYKADESAVLARMIEDQTVAEIDTDLGLRVNELGAKKGPFYVLVGAQMPAVLVECGFLSNTGETSRLIDDRYQTVLADAIAAAIGGYFKSAAAGNL